MEVLTGTREGEWLWEKTQRKVTGKREKLQEEIRKRIGRSVLIAYIVVEVIIVIIMGQTVYYNKQARSPWSRNQRPTVWRDFLKNTRE